MTVQQFVDAPVPARSEARPAIEWQRTVDALDAIVILIGSSGRITGANEAAQRAAAAVGIDELLGLPADFLRTMDPWAGAVALAGTISPAMPEARAEVGDSYFGRTWDVSVRLVPDGDGDGDGRVAILRDVSNVVALEASARHNERVAELGRLVGNVAHEVRNPLFSMSATLDALEVRVGPAPLIARYIENLRRELRRMTALMQDLLEYGKPPVLEARVEKVSAPLLDAIAAVAPAASARNIKLHFEPPAEPIMAILDRSRIAQAFQNILENAVHYSAHGSTIRIRLALTEVESEIWLACSIEDEGPGFPDDVLPMVFEPFYTTRAGGTGLGLSIVRRIVQMHGGQVFAANKPEGGARVTVSLPGRTGEA